MENKPKKSFPDFKTSFGGIQLLRSHKMTKIWTLPVHTCLILVTPPPSHPPSANVQNITSTPLHTTTTYPLPKQ